MSAFEFFFGFYGLILGLSVVEVITGGARILKQRRRIRVGYLTPMLALVVLLDLSGFWSTSWVRYQGIEVSSLLLVVGLAIAGTYFLAASLVFPEDLDAWSSLDDFYDTHKSWVIGGIWLAKTASHTLLLLVTGKTDVLISFWTSPPLLAVVIPLFALMLAVSLVKNHRANGIMLLLIISAYFTLFIGVTPR